MSRTNTGSRKDTFFGRTARQLRQLEAAAERKESAGLSPGAPSFTKFFAGAGEVAAGISVAAQEVSRRLEPVAEWARSPEGAEVLRFVVAVAKDVQERGGDERAVTRAFGKMLLGCEPDALLVAALGGSLGDRPLSDLRVIRDSHRKRLSIKALASKSKEEVAKVSSGIKLSKSHRFALDGLRQGDPGQSRDEMLAHFIRVARVEDSTAPIEEIRRRVGNAVRREARTETVVPPGARAASKLTAHLDGEEPELARFIEHENARQEAERLRRDAAQASLSKGERETFALILDGHGISETAHIRGRSESQIRQEKLRGLRKIEEFRRAAGQ